MVLDIITLLVLVWAIFKGLRKGLLMAVFSLLAFLIGLAAALKLSAVTAVWLDDTVNVSARWLPVISFLLVFIIVVIIVNWAGGLLEKTVEWAYLGWLNKAGGIIFYCLLNLLVWSIVLFYLGKMGILSDESMEQSNTYPIIAPWGPKAMNWLAQLVPFFKDVFEDLGKFFDRLSNEVKPSVEA
jgi:membrane protein required for colicin V production